LNKKSHTTNYTFAVQKGKTTTKYAAALHYIYTHYHYPSKPRSTRARKKIKQSTLPCFNGLPRNIPLYHSLTTISFPRLNTSDVPSCTSDSPYIGTHPPFRRVSPRVPPSWLVRVWGKHAARRRCGTGDGLRRHVCVFLSRGERREGSSAGCMLATGR
jgi:hypothetical protein